MRYEWLDLAFSLEDPFDHADFVRSAREQGVVHALQEHDYLNRLASIKGKMASEKVDHQTAYRMVIDSHQSPATGGNKNPPSGCGGCGSDLPPFPNTLNMALSVGLAVKRWVSSGGQNVDKLERAKRLEACRACPMLDGQRCRKCGCFVKVKSWMATEDCPEGKW